MEFRLLGPVEVRVGGRVLDGGHARQRAVLAVLLLEAGRVVPVDRLVDRVWGEDPPGSARSTLYGYVARLRAILAADGEGVGLVRRSGGYVLEAERERVDVFRFRRLVAEAGAAGEDERRAVLLGEALGLWRGQALAGLESPWLRSARDALERERHAAALEGNDARLRLGQHAALAVELAGQAAAAPGDERLAGQLMLALYRSGEAAQALRVFERTRGCLAEELGADPGPALRGLHEQILRADPALNLPAAAALGRAAALVPRELPADVSGFTGREAELAALDGLLLGGEHPTAAVISAVSGTAGVGKTALAVHWAHRAAASFPDGQLHVNLRGYDPAQPVTAADALARFLGSLGVPGPEIPAEEDDRAARYRSLLAGRRMLVVLDNAATVEQVRPLLPGTPSCAVVVTSRDSLAGLVARNGARRLDLDLLPLDDAVALLRELVGAHADTDLGALTELAEQCARLPLALRVAAELASSRPGTALADLAAELADERRRLDLLSADADPRTAVRAVFSWSCDHLDAQSVRAFRLAGLHPGADFESYAVAALAGSTIEESRRVLGTLARAHLIQPTAPGRYGMHDLLRAYARDLAAEVDGEEGSRTALTRLFDCYLSAAATAVDTLQPARQHRRPRVEPSRGPAPQINDPDTALAWLDDERANLAAITVHAAGHGWPGHATQMCGVLRHYLLQNGHIAAEVLIHTAARRAARETGDLAAEATALTGLGGVAWREGRYQHASGHLQEALTLLQKADDGLGQARALYSLAVIDWAQGAYPSAARRYLRALPVFREAGDLTGQAQVLNGLGALAHHQGRYRQAALRYRRALALFRKTKDRSGEATVLGNLGEIEGLTGRYRRAADHHLEALGVSRELGDRSTEAQALHNLGQVDNRLGRYCQAASWLRQALAIHGETGDAAGEAEVRNDLGDAYLGDGLVGEAEREHATALALASQIGHKRQQAHAHHGLANCREAVGDVNGARQHWRQALALFTELGTSEAAEVRARLGELASTEAGSRTGPTRGRIRAGG